MWKVKVNYGHKGASRNMAHAEATYTDGDFSFVFEGKLEADDDSEKEKFVGLAKAAMEKAKLLYDKAFDVQSQLENMLN